MFLPLHKPKSNQTNQLWPETWKTTSQKKTFLFNSNSLVSYLIRLMKMNKPPGTILAYGSVTKTCWSPSPCGHCLCLRWVSYMLNSESLSFLYCVGFLLQEQSFKENRSFYFLKSLFKEPDDNLYFCNSSERFPNTPVSTRTGDRPSAFCVKCVYVSTVMIVISS